MSAADVVIDTNKWTDKKTQKLLADSDISKIYSLCHARAYEYYKRSFQRITMIIALLGATTTILEGTNLLLDKPEIGIGVAVLICAALSGVLGQQMNSKDPSTLAAAHQEMSKGYNRIILNIEAELVNEYDEREPGTDFLKSITKSLIDLSTGGQILPTFIWKEIEGEMDSNKLDPNKYWGQSDEVEDIRHTIADTDMDHIVDMSGNVIPLTSPIPHHTIIDVDNISDADSANPMPSMEIRANPGTVQSGKLRSQFQSNRFRFG